MAQCFLEPPYPPPAAWHAFANAMHHTCPTNRQVDWKPFFHAWNWENSHQQHLQLTTLTKFILIPPPSLSSAPQKRRFFEWASHLLKLSRGLTFKQLFKRRMSSIGCETQQLQAIACAKKTLGKARGTTGDLTQTIPTPKNLASKK